MRKKFTEWYFKKGYVFDCRLGFICPAPVKIVCNFLFSPSIYYRCVGDALQKGFVEWYNQSEFAEEENY